MEVRVAEAAVNLHRQRLARRLVRLQCRNDAFRDMVEPAAVGRDRLQSREARRTCVGDRAGTVRLEPQHGQRAAAGELAEPLPFDPGSRLRVAVVDEQDFGAGRAQQRSRVLLEVTRETVLVDRALRRLDAEVVGELAQRAPVREAGRYVWPLARVGALREQTAKLVDRRLRVDEPVRVMVDERDRVQYFEK